MGEYAIQAQFEAMCSPSDVMRWLATTDGLAGWWTDSVTGSAAAPGDVFHARFPTSDVMFDLEVIDASDRVVAWHVPQSPAWWKGTTIRFEVTEAEDGKSSLLFTHTGFEPDDPIIAVITPAWVRFLDRLVQVAQTGEANPVVVS